MKHLKIKPLKFCFISTKAKSYLADYINLTPYHTIIDISFEELNFTALKNYNPTIIVVDNYFTEKDNAVLINSLRMNFRTVSIYILSPTFDKSQKLINDEGCRNHYFSCFSNRILNHINTYIQQSGEKRSYLEVG